MPDPTRYGASATGRLRAEAPQGFRSKRQALFLVASHMPLAHPESPQKGLPWSHGFGVPKKSAMSKVTKRNLWAKQKVLEE